MKKISMITILSSLIFLSGCSAGNVTPTETKKVISITRNGVNITEQMLAENIYAMKNENGGTSGTRSKGVSYFLTNLTREVMVDFCDGDINNTFIAQFNDYEEFKKSEPSDLFKKLGITIKYGDEDLTNSVYFIDSNGKRDDSWWENAPFPKPSDQNQTNNYLSKNSFGRNGYQFLTYDENESDLVDVAAYKSTLDKKYTFDGTNPIIGANGQHLVEGTAESFAVTDSDGNVTPIKELFYTVNNGVEINDVPTDVFEQSRFNGQIKMDEFHTIKKSDFCQV